MTEISRHDIIDHSFEKKRRGYDPAAVDQFLERIAGHVERLQSELSRQTTDGTALDLLKQAERTARDTRLSAEIDARREREAAVRDAEHARVEASDVVEKSRLEAERLRSEAEAEARRIVTQAEAHAATIRLANDQQSVELEQTLQEVSEFVTNSAGDLRVGAGRLIQLAEWFESQSETRCTIASEALQRSGGPSRLASAPPARPSEPTMPPQEPTIGRRDNGGARTL